MASYQDTACADCGKVRRVQIREGQPISLRCHPCGARHRATASKGSWRSREKHPRWKGGRHVTSSGYVQVVVPLGDSMMEMADARGRVYEHRLVMARHLGRPLLSTEQVHHRNGDKQDNRFKNLEVTTRADHAAAHHREVVLLRARVRELERELAALKAQTA